MWPNLTWSPPARQVFLGSIYFFNNWIIKISYRDGPKWTSSVRQTSQVDCEPKSSQAIFEGLLGFFRAEERSWEAPSFLMIFFFKSIPLFEFSTGRISRCLFFSACLNSFKAETISWCRTLPHAVSKDLGCILTWLHVQNIVENNLPPDRTDPVRTWRIATFSSIVCACLCRLSLVYQVHYFSWKASVHLGPCCPCLMMSGFFDLKDFTLIHGVSSVQPSHHHTSLWH